jgi:hypothetical protein
LLLTDDGQINSDAKHCVVCGPPRGEDQDIPDHTNITTIRILPDGHTIEVCAVSWRDRDDAADAENARPDMGAIEDQGRGNNAPKH